MGTTLTVLGSGSPMPSLTRASSGYLLRTGDDVIVIDHGPGAFLRLLEAGVGPTDVTHVFISHLHFDHVFDFLRLFHHRWDLTGIEIPPMRLYGPPGFQIFLDRIFGPDGAFAPDLTARTRHPVSQAIYHGRGGTGRRPWPRIDAEELSDGGRIEGDGWQCRIQSVPHHQPYLENFGFRFETLDGVVAYTSDVAFGRGEGPPEEVLVLAHGADLLVHYLNVIAEGPAASGAPSKATLVGRLAREAGVRVLVTTHHGPAMDLPEVMETVLANIRSAFDGEVHIGTDLAEFRIGDRREPL